MQTERQYQKPGYRRDTSQLPRNRHSVAAWMAEMDRQRGERIRDLRDAHAWTQRQLADRLQVDPKTVHNWEKGKDLLGDNLRDLAECFDVSMNYIRYGEREAPDLGELLNVQRQRVAVPARPHRGEPGAHPRRGRALYDSH
jgi:transcriptional regulator with XRE-family HTH domain